MDIHLNVDLTTLGMHSGPNSGSPSASNSYRNLVAVKEEAQWESCSPRVDRARNVRARNVNERNRLQLVQSTLDRQLERELRRITNEKNNFNGVLEQLQNEKTRLNSKPMSARMRTFSSSLPDLVNSLEPPRSSPHVNRRASPGLSYTRADLSPTTNGRSRSCSRKVRSAKSKSPNTTC